MNKYQNKVFFLPSYKALVYCHKETKDNLILGGIAQFYNDAKTMIIRQRIKKQKFRNLKPVVIDDTKFKTYPFLRAVTVDKLLSKHWRVRHPFKDTGNYYLKTATQLKTLHKNTYNEL